MIIDSLISLDYKILEQNYSTFFDSLPDSSLAYAKAYIQKAKIESNKNELQVGYLLMTYLVSNDMAIKYCDSTIGVAKSIGDKNILASAYFKKGGFYFDNRNFKKALDSYLQADQLSNAVDSEEFPYFIQYSIGTLKVRLSKHKEAKEIFKNCKQYLEGKESMGPYNYFYLSVLHALSNAYRRLGSIDSSSTINKLGYKEASIIKDSNSLSHFIVNEGINYLEKKDPKVALDSMLKGVKYFEKTKSNPNLIVTYYYIGRAYEESDNMILGMPYYKQVDSLFRITNDLKPESRDAYDRMIAYYRKNRDDGNLLKTIEGLLKVDSVLNSNYRYLNTYIVKKYDTPQLLAEKEELIVALNKGKRNIGRWIYVLIALLVVAALTIYYYVKKQREYQKRFEELLKTSATKNSKSSKNQNDTGTVGDQASTNLKTIGISEELVHEIQSKLQAFVENEGYLKNSITLSSLSKEFNTNSKYLSKLINFYEQKNFSKYINDLRIDYTMQRLQNDRVFKNYAIKAIADEVGFNNTESFSKAFYKKTGIYPSFFIKQLQKNIK
ncbi:helix-turn-helix domain-containing protein [Ascidiimonas sp. W6]|uniref:helix-turn-helix domain-containing protein n=1 Tax=Ascidiimonas meishanensis TaxID=3128903 RepID=UPI0030ECC46A